MIVPTIGRSATPTFSRMPSIPKAGPGIFFSIVSEKAMSTRRRRLTSFIPKTFPPTAERICEALPASKRASG